MCNFHYDVFCHQLSGGMVNLKFKFAYKLRKILIDRPNDPLLEKR